LQVLVQGHDEKSGFCRGLTRNYLTVAFAGGKEMINREVPVRIEEMGATTDLAGVAVA